MIADVLFTGWTRRLAHCLAALATLMLLPVLVRAETLVFRNDTTAPLVLQGACVIKGQLQNDRPLLVAPGGVVRVNLPGNKLITVYDARMPNRTLYQGTIQSGTDDLYYSVQPDTLPGNMVPTKVKLEQVKPPPPAKPAPTPSR